MQRLSATKITHYACSQQYIILPISQLIHAQWRSRIFSFDSPPWLISLLISRVFTSMASPPEDDQLITWIILMDCWNSHWSYKLLFPLAKCCLVLLERSKINSKGICIIELYKCAHVLFYGHNVAFFIKEEFC